MKNTPLENLEPPRTQPATELQEDLNRACPTADAGFREAITEEMKRPTTVLEKRRQETLRLATVTLIATIAALTLLAAFTLVVGIVVRPLDTLLRSPAGPSAG